MCIGNLTATSKAVKKVSEVRLFTIKAICKPNTFVDISLLLLPYFPN